MVLGMSSKKGPEDKFDESDASALEKLASSSVQLTNK